MSESEPRPERAAGAASRAIVILLGLLLLLVLYVASVGPAAWIVRRYLVPGAGGPPSSWVMVLMCVYMPLDWIAMTDTPPAHWLHAYVEWWTGP